MKRRRRTGLPSVVGGVLVIATLLAPAVAIPAAATATPHSNRAPTWATYDPATRTARLTLISAYRQDTFNFNGATGGGLTFTVPVGARVIVHYTNNSPMMPHAAEVVAYNGSLPTQFPPPPPAFPGAASPNYRHGTPPGVTQQFSFVANRAGKYLLICPVRNHVKHGHWAWFIVSRKATTATATLK